MPANEALFRTRFLTAARRAGRVGWNSLAFLGAIMLFYHLFFDVSAVISGSMAPTLRSESEAGCDWVLTEKITYRLRRPRRWETVMFHDEGLQIMKRVVGLPGESVSIRTDDDVVLVNEGPPERPEKLAALRHYAYGKMRPGTALAAGEGFVLLGDDSKDSFDSRFTGPLSGEKVEGRPWLIVWPLSRIGFVNP
ncbi:MAG: signal peptidase I [Planctomycetes bacterium]|nr:signal peptidase I [Planctomycetota bacterium]